MEVVKFSEDICSFFSFVSFSLDARSDIIFLVNNKIVGNVTVLY